LTSNAVNVQIFQNTLVPESTMFCKTRTETVNTAILTKRSIANVCTLQQIKKMQDNK